MCLKLCWLGIVLDCPKSHSILALTLMCCASAVCWFSNHGGADKLGCFLRALPIAARSGSFIASTVNVCVYLGAAAAAMGCCLQGEIHLITFQFLMQCTSKCNHLHAKRMSLLHAATKRATCFLFEPDFVCSPDTFLNFHHPAGDKNVFFRYLLQSGDAIQRDVVGRLSSG